MGMRCSTALKCAPDRARLLQRPIDLTRRPCRDGSRRLLLRVAVVKSGSGGKDGVGEPGGHGDVVVPDGLVGGDQHRQRLADVHVEGRVVVLHGVSALRLHQLHRVRLQPDVQRVLQPNVGDPQPVRLACSAQHRDGRRS